MVVFGKRKNENVGKSLFQGDLRECRDFITDEVCKADYEELNIDEDNGVIVERII